MADGKKSFVLYADLIHTVRKLPKTKRGELFMTILEYVNDLNPVVDDLLVSVAFEPVKNQLKRDLQEWEQTKTERSKSGHIGGIKSGEVRRAKKQTEANEASASKSKQTEANEAVTVTVTVNDTVTGNVNDITTTKRKAWCRELLNDERWLMVVSRDFNLSDKSRIENHLELYLNHLIQIQKEDHDNYSAFASHFCNWMRKRKAEITEIEAKFKSQNRKKEVVITDADRAAIEEMRGKTEQFHKARTQ